MADEQIADRKAAFDELVALVQKARAMANERVGGAVTDGSFTLESYVRFLRNQYYITRGVQKHLLRVMASERLARFRTLREFLYRFALDEEPHYLLAQRDLEALGEPLGPKPLEAAMWWGYFDSVIEDEPFQRLGGTCVLENIGVGLGTVIRELSNRVDYLKAGTTRFLKVHLHEQIPHGEEILNALRQANLTVADLTEVIAGARFAAVSYLRMIEWYFDSDRIVSSFEEHALTGNISDAK